MLPHVFCYVTSRNLVDRYNVSEKPVLQTTDWNLRLHQQCVDLLFLFSLLFYFFCHSNRWWTFTSSKIVLHCSRSCYSRLHFLTPIVFRSSSTDSGHLNLGVPTRRMPCGLRTESSQQGSSSCILKSCPSHLRLPIFITLTMSTSRRA